MVCSVISILVLLCSSAPWPFQVHVNDSIPTDKVYRSHRIILTGETNLIRSRLASRTCARICTRIGHIYMRGNEWELTRGINEPLWESKGEMSWGKGIINNRERISTRLKRISESKLNTIRTISTFHPSFCTYVIYITTRTQRLESSVCALSLPWDVKFQK